MGSQLPEVVLVRIFSFLDAHSLLQASQVSKYWNKVAERDHLWRTLCLKRWSFCSAVHQRLDTWTWKQLFFHQRKQERRLTLSQPEDFVCKEASGNLGFLGPMEYLSENGLTMDGKEKSVLCTVSSNRLLYVWDVQEGAILWASPVQKSRIEKLVTLPQMYLVMTVDVEGTIKVWNCQDEDALAALTMPRGCVSVDACLTKDGPFLLVGDSQGDIYTFTVPELKQVSKVTGYQFSVDLLHCSPDKKWVFACGKLQNFTSKVFLMEGLLSGTHQTVPLPFSSCCRACWAPGRDSRITMMCQRGPNRKTGFPTFELLTERTQGKTAIRAQQLASFLLSDNLESPNWMGVGTDDMIVFDSGPYLYLSTIGGLIVQRFQDHQGAICSLWVDSLRVLTTSVDNALHVYMWEKGSSYPYLQSCCHLEHRSHGQPSGSYASSVTCDSMSIVRMVSRSRHSSVLMMYSLNM
ncbi:F-box/WD repeat-containing protein 12 [Tupaia chinensis]|uniref:F-box/WD repeat-containing protein 12 n=1 Tax=Tupaia chinensis TaxID=246437 RepID=UPI0003C9233B|nr:F-box/WD repeat-containing protein 12 [Tupaia chinensis]